MAMAEEDHQLPSARSCSLTVESCLN